MEHRALEDEQALPSLEKGERVPVREVVPSQHFTEPPPRFSEASLVKELERLGIGRPSTYAQIILTLVDRHYTQLEQRRFFPTAGVPTGQIYADTDGDSWDYLAIDPVTDASPGCRGGRRCEDGLADRTRRIARVPQICCHAYRHLRDRADDARAISGHGRAIR